MKKREVTNLEYQSIQQEKHMNILNGLGIILLATIIAALIAVLVAFPVMLLWNAVIPSIFGLTTITFTQALFLSMLTSLLFKSNFSSSSK